MTTMTLLLIMGIVVGVKTCAFVGFVVRRGRRQRRALEAAAQAVVLAETAAHEPGDHSAWRLQWSEPGVMLVENTSDDVAARDVELSATLTAATGAAASLEQVVRFVATGASFTARFADVDPWLALSTLSCSLAWLTPEGVRRRETWSTQRVVPVPDLTLGIA